MDKMYSNCTVTRTLTDEEKKEEEALYEELWRACAGPLVDIPEFDEKVFYFPQGHIEQLKATTNDEMDIQIPQLGLSSKILCRVMAIELKAEHDTDDVYAEITLLPLPEGDEPKAPEPSVRPERPRPKVQMYCKILTASDTSTHGGFSILRKHATDCMPPLDTNMPIPTQELVAKDLHGYEWRLKHIFRGQPRRHLLTTGWSSFVTSKRVTAGDAFVFVRGEKGAIRVGIRRLVHQPNPMPPSVISSQSMHLGVLATAKHAVGTGTRFTIYYKPRSAQFIVGVNKYLEAVNRRYNIGMRFNMRFEGDDAPERSFRFAGTIVGVEDLSPDWPDSKWRSLKVQWDEPATFNRPGRVSPWEIEPFVASIPSPPPISKTKRSRPETNGGSAASDFRYGTPHTHSVSSPGNQQDRGILPSIDGRNSTRFFADNKNDNKDSSVQSFSSPLAYSSAVPSRPRSDPLEQLNISKTSARVIRLFGNEFLSYGPLVPTTPEKVTESPENLSNDVKFVEADEVQNTLFKEPLKEEIQSDASPKKTQTKQSSQFSARSRTKVHMQGCAVGRAIDLTMFEGYDELICELERMFAIEGELQKGAWAAVFTDDESDIMLLGDDPWQEFCKMAKKILIYPNEELKKINWKSTMTTISADEDAVLSLGNEQKFEAHY